MNNALALGAVFIELCFIERESASSWYAILQSGGNIAPPELKTVKL
jgi:hypothetical protein